MTGGDVRADRTARVDIGVCLAADLPLLRVGWPTPGTDVHGFHFAAQSRGDATFLVAWNGNDPQGEAMVRWIGCVGANAIAAYPRCVEINHLQVRSEYRHRGVGSALIHASEDLIRERRLTEASVGVGLDNPDAARLYERLGYQRTGVTDGVSYTWVDDAGVSHLEDEQTELLVKHLPEH